MSDWQEVKEDGFEDYLVYEAEIENSTYRIITDKKGGWYAAKYFSQGFFPPLKQIIYSSGAKARAAVENGDFDLELEKLINSPDLPYAAQ